MKVGPLSDEPIDLATGHGLTATMICGMTGHPGCGQTMAECERTVRGLERGGGVGQWLLAVKDDHRAALEPLRAAAFRPPWLPVRPAPPPYAPDLDMIRWIEDHRHGPSRPRRLSCLWACPHRELDPAALDRLRARFRASLDKPPRLLTPLPWRTRAVLAATRIVNRLAARLIAADHPEAARRLWQVTGLWD